MKTRRSARRHPVICAAFLATARLSPGDTFNVDLGDTLTVSSAVSGDLLKLGPGTLILHGPQTYPGPTTLSAGILRFGGSSGDRIPDGPGKGNLVFNNTSVPAVLDLAGFSETINGLLGSSTTAKRMDDSNASSATLTFGHHHAW